MSASIAVWIVSLTIYSGQASREYCASRRPTHECSVVSCVAPKIPAGAPPRAPALPGPPLAKFSNIKSHSAIYGRLEARSPRAWPWTWQYIAATQFRSAPAGLATRLSWMEASAVRSIFASHWLSFSLYNVTSLALTYLHRTINMYLLVQ